MKSWFPISTNQCHLAAYYQVPDGRFTCSILLQFQAGTSDVLWIKVHRHTCVHLEPFKKTFVLIEKTLLLEGSRLKNQSFPGSQSFLQANAFLLTLFSPLATNSVMTLVSRLKLPSTALMCRCEGLCVFYTPQSKFMNQILLRMTSKSHDFPRLCRQDTLQDTTHSIGSFRAPPGDANWRCCGHSVVREGSFQQFAVFLPFLALVVPGAIERPREDRGCWGVHCFRWILLL